MVFSETSIYRSEGQTRKSKRMEIEAIEGQKGGKRKKLQERIEEMLTLILSRVNLMRRDSKLDQRRV